MCSLDEHDNARDLRVTFNVVADVTSEGSTAQEVLCREVYNFLQHSGAVGVSHHP